MRAANRVGGTLSILGLIVGAPVARALELPKSQASARSTTDLHDRYPIPVLPFDRPEPEQQPTDSLATAIVEAYAGNPNLGARRYELRAIDDGLGVALSQLRPTTQVQISSGYDFTNPGRATQANRPLVDRLNSPFIERNDMSAQFVVDQPLLTGGRAHADILAANRDIRAGREALRGAEGDLLFNVISAYADVQRDVRSLRIRERNARVLGSTLDEVIARREAGELTRTDVAQAQTQLEAAHVQLNAAQEQLEQSRAIFTALVGREPGILAPVPNLPLIPATIDDAFDSADQTNPELSAAIEAERASRARIASARAEGRPNVALRGIAGVAGPAVPFDRRDEDISFSGRATLTIPLTAGGRIASHIHQALDRNSADQMRIEAARRDMVRNIVAAWNQWVTASRNEKVQQTQLKAARVYYEGTFEEYRAGLRSTFDVLYAQNALRETEIALLASARDKYVSQAALLRQIGQLEVATLIGGASLYDASAHARSIAKIGATPWDGAIHGLDALSAPGQHGQKLEQAPRASGAPGFVNAAFNDGDRALATQSRTTSSLGTAAMPTTRNK